MLNNLNNKVKAAEDEKASLLTATRLLHSDRNISLDTDYDKNTWSTKSNQRAASKIARRHTKNTVLGQNKFAPLIIEETEADKVETYREVHKLLTKCLLWEILKHKKWKMSSSSSQRLSTGRTIPV